MVRSTEPIEECELAVPEGREVECLMDTVKAQLRKRSTLSRQEEVAMRKQAMMRNVPAGTAIPDDLLAAAGVCGWPFVCRDTSAGGPLPVTCRALQRP